MLKDEVLEAGLRRLADLFGKSLSASQVQYYIQLLRPWVDDEFDWLYALRVCGENLKFFPAPAQLIEAIHGSLEDRAQQEWATLDQQISPVGRKALKAIGGWTAYKAGGDAERRQFVAAYVAAGRGAGREDFIAEPIVLEASPPVLPPAPPIDAGEPDGVRGLAVRDIPAIGPAVNAELGIKRETDRPYTNWEILLHRWYLACQFGGEAQRERLRARARAWGREHLLPAFKPLAGSRRPAV